MAGSREPATAAPGVDAEGVWDGPVGYRCCPGDRDQGSALIDTLLGLAAVGALVAANALFVAGEFCLVAVDAAQVDRLAAGGHRRARLTRGLLSRLSYHLSGAQLGITVTSLVVGFVAEPTVGEVIAPALDAIPGLDGTSGSASRVAISLALATVFQLVLGELVPKNFAIARPSATAYLLAPVLSAYGVLAKPIIRMLDESANRISRLVGVEPQAELKARRTQEDFELLMRSSAAEGALSERDAHLLTRVLRFGNKTVAEVLVPRTALVALPVEATLEDLAGLARESGRSRVIVHGEDLDDVVGVAHVRDLFAVPAEQRSERPVTDIVTDAFVVPESRELGTLLEELRGRADRLAVVVDEYGGTAGIVTLEDLLEEIVGEIQDEHDANDPDLTPLRRADGYELEGSLHLDEVNDLIGLELPAGEYETLAGFLLEVLGRVPIEGDTADHDGWHYEIIDMDRLRIARVLVTPTADR